MARSKVLDALSQITDELKNFERIARAIKPKPGSIPELDGIDVHGEIVPLNGVVGGDHLIVSRAPRKNGPRLQGTVGETDRGSHQGGHLRVRRSRRRHHAGCDQESIGARGKTLKGPVFARRAIGKAPRDVRGRANSCRIRALPPETVFQGKESRVQRGQRFAHLCQFRFGTVNFKLDDLRKFLGFLEQRTDVLDM